MATELVEEAPAQVRSRWWHRLLHGLAATVMAQRQHRLVDPVVTTVLRRRWSSSTRHPILMSQLHGDPGGGACSAFTLW